MHKKRQWKVNDLLVLISFPVIAVLLSIDLRANTLLSIILFYLPLSMYLSYRTQKAVLKTFVFAILITIPFVIVFDYPAYLDKSWFVVSMFSYRLYGFVSWEDILWTFFFAYTVVIFYENFIDKAKHHVLEGRIKYGIMLIVLFILAFFTLYFFKPQFLILPYYYFWLGLCFIFLPVIAILSYYHKLITGFFITASYFFAYSLLYELTALSLHQWYFPGNHYIGWVKFGALGLPFEEFFFFIIISSMSIVTYFEFLDVRKI